LKDQKSEILENDIGYDLTDGAQFVIAQAIKIFKMIFILPVIKITACTMENGVASAAASGSIQLMLQVFYNKIN
jgi:hypothetical protein